MTAKRRAPTARVRTRVSRLTCGAVRRHCYQLVVEQRRGFLRCAICGAEVA